MQLTATIVLLVVLSLTDCRKRSAKLKSGSTANRNDRFLICKDAPNTDINAQNDIEITEDEDYVSALDAMGSGSVNAGQPRKLVYVPQPFPIVRPPRGFYPFFPPNAPANNIALTINFNVNSDPVTGMVSSADNGIQLNEIHSSPAVLSAIHKPTAVSQSAYESLSVLGQKNQTNASKHDPRRILTEVLAGVGIPLSTLHDGAQPAFLGPSFGANPEQLEETEGETASQTDSDDEDEDDEENTSYPIDQGLRNAEEVPVDQTTSTALPPHSENTTGRPVVAEDSSKAVPLPTESSNSSLVDDLFEDYEEQPNNIVNPVGVTALADNSTHGSEVNGKDRLAEDHSRRSPAEIHTTVPEEHTLPAQIALVPEASATTIISQPELTTPYARLSSNTSEKSATVAALASQEAALSSQLDMTNDSFTAVESSSRSIMEAHSEPAVEETTARIESSSSLWTSTSSVDSGIASSTSQQSMPSASSAETVSTGEPEDYVGEEYDDIESTSNPLTSAKTTKAPESDSEKGIFDAADQYFKAGDISTHSDRDEKDTRDGGMLTLLDILSNSNHTETRAKRQDPASSQKKVVRRRRTRRISM